MVAIDFDYGIGRRYVLAVWSYWCDSYLAL